MPIGVVIAGLFTAPLFVLIISAIFQSKSVGLMRWLVVGLGFLEALLVTQPDPSALDLVAFLPVCAGFFYVIGAIATRAWCEGEQTLRLTYDFWWYWHFYSAKRGQFGGAWVPDAWMDACQYYDDCLVCGVVHWRINRNWFCFSGLSSW